MMREILFRGKRTDNGEWVEGYYVKAELLNGSGEEHVIIEYSAEGTTYHVISETVGQFTGLTDKNGTKIFEGDIVKCTDENNLLEFCAIVEFGNPNGEYNWGWQLKYIKGTKVNMDILCWVDMEDLGAYIEVIGNIYDNPELMEVEND